VLQLHFISASFGAVCGKALWREMEKDYCKASEEDTSRTAVSFCNKMEDVVRRERNYAVDWSEI